MKKRLGIFLLFTFALSWLLALALALCGGLAAPWARLALAAIMLVPALGMLFTRIVTKEGFADAGLRPRFRGHIRYYVLAWLLPPVLIALGAVLYFICFPAQFDANMTGILQTYAAQGVDIPAQTLRQAVLLQLVLAVFIAPVLNIIPTLGEELGWRAYLLPKLCQRYTPLQASLLTGVIWGVWHAPIIAMGYNYGLGYPGAPWGGIAAMVVFCVFVGALFSYWTLKAGSVYPAAIAHGALNGFASAAAAFVVGKPNIFLGPLPVGLIGGAGLLVAGVVSMVLLQRMRRQTAGQDAEAV
nr:CPBP family intramembrane glutamic endopeptidase [Maliibacterium massiliense]